MSYTNKKLEDMDVMDDFLMGQLASDESCGEDFCRLLISTLLQKRVGNLRVSMQKIISGLTPALRGIRLDVEVEELGDAAAGEEPAVMNIYDIEPHLYKDMDIPRHNRFYQARIDSRGLQSGERDFAKLPNLYVLMILCFDPFGKDRMVYTIRNRCEEEPEMEYEDGLKFCYFYTKGMKGGNESLKSMLVYMQDSREENVTDQATARLHDYVSRVKTLPEVKDAYMTLEEYVYYKYREEREQARKEGRAEGLEEGRVEGRKEGRMEGRMEGREEGSKEAAISTFVQGIQDILEDYGVLPERLLNRIQETDDREVLRQWLKLAARADSIEAFEAGMQTVCR